MLKFDLGLVFSTTGPYAALGQAARAGAELALADLEAEGRARITPVFRSPDGCPEAYESMTDDILRGGVTQVVGAITSWSRKDMIPVLERHGALLWYPTPYEGYESNDHVVYMGAAPNHHMVPLLDRVLGMGVQRAYLLGSNYVWGWETLRQAQERLRAAGVEIVGERYLPIGETDCARALAEVKASGADLVVNSLVGWSNYTFLRGLPIEDRPCIVSCNTTEAELHEIGEAGEGLLSAAPFFEETAPMGFVPRAAAIAPNGRCSGFFATAYASVRMVADAVARAGTTDPKPVFNAACSVEHDTVLGPVTIDPVTRHAALTPHIAQLFGGRFHVVSSKREPVPADPYLINQPPPRARPSHAPALRVVK